jgi:hypothetical protein
VSSCFKQFSYGLINLKGKVSEASIANVICINANSFEERASGREVGIDLSEKANSL